MNRFLLRIFRLTGSASMVFLFVCSLVGVTQRQELAAGISLRLDPRSPLAIGGDNIYAVADNGKTIVSRPLDRNKGSWVPLLGGGAFQRVSGLAYFDESLYVVDQETSALFRVPIEDPRPILIHSGSPFVHLSEVAIVGDQICLVDSGTGVIFRLHVPGGPLSQIQLESKWFSRGEPTHIGSWQDDLVLSQTTVGTFFELSYVRFPRSSKISDFSNQSSPNRNLRGVTSSTCAQSSCLLDTYQWKPDSEELLHPGPVATQDGIVYVVDDETRQIYAFSRHGKKPIRVVYDKDGVTRPSRVLPAGDNLLVLDDEKGDVVTWPNLVPAEILVDLETSESLSAFYNYLFDEQILPVKTVKLHKNIETTLREQRVLISPFVASLGHVICGLNEGICVRGELSTALQEDTPIIIPDIYSESYIDARSVTLSPGTTLGELVDRWIKSPGLIAWRDEAKLREMNPQFKAIQSASIRSQRSGTFTIPIELVRYLAAIPSSDLQLKNSRLAEVRSANKTLNVISLQEVPASPEESQQIPELTNDMASFAAAYQKMLDTIHYLHPPSSAAIRTPFVGIAEKEIDCDSPDFDGNVCANMSDEIPSVPDSAAPVSPPDSYRPFDIADHGTAVTALIAARHMSFVGKGLAAPEAVVVPLHETDPAIGEDIRKAYVNMNARIFNLSLTFPKGVLPANLARYIDQDSSAAYANALFVVAADKDGFPACGAQKEYPLCWGTQPNVIVVAASSLDGKTLLQNDGGSNWGQKFVHVAAPGSGFGVTARNRSYAPVAGTSFAAPLVSATAALLYAEGISDPWSIKQRIISTSDPMPEFNGKITAGLLNVKRAVSSVSRAVLVGETGQEQSVQLIPNQSINVTWSDGSQDIPLAHVLRLTRDATGSFRIVYIDPGDSKALVIRENVSFDARHHWKSKYNVLRVDNSVDRANQKDDLANYKDYVGPIL